MVICIDFDGTCVTHDFPRIGKEIGAVPVLRALVENGHQLILFTMRSDLDQVDTSEEEDLHNAPRQYLTQAVDWFKKHNIPLYGIQKNPTQNKWTTSPKAYGQLYIDDAALGIPLKSKGHSRDYVDWEKTRKLLVKKGIL